jgi:hypothetical protein
MIYNRTYIDIINAKKIFANKVQKFIELTDEEKGTIDRAFFNLSAINRITAKINDIWNGIAIYGVDKIESEDVREWGEQEIFIGANFSNIRQNIAEIIAKMADLDFIEREPFQKAYNVLTNEYIYTNLNNLEKLLFDMGEFLSKMAFLKGKELYIVGAYSATLSEGVLTIE